MIVEKSNIEGLKVLLGVTAGIAAYKAVDLASKLTACGAKVQTIMTENACQLVGPKSFEAVTKSAVFTKLFSTSDEYRINHINLTDWADIVVVAPATADIIAKIAAGICDDILSTTLCVCWNKPVLLSPAMNNNMWNNPVVQQNIEKIKKIGFKLIGPAEGRLACGTVSIGRMAEPAEIIEQIKEMAHAIK